MVASAGRWYRPAMGIRNYLIEGLSGTGKTSACKELRRRGYHAINGDRELAYQGDPETGKPTNCSTREPSAIFTYEHHIWDVEKVKDLIANHDTPVSFFCGHSRNLAKFIELFDDVFILDADLDTVNRRVAERVALDPTDWGAKNQRNGN
jgi:broad-specificity NMP kinase